jgi:SOS regulatory protein LexA
MHKIQENLIKLLEEKNVNGMTLREIGDLIGEQFPQKIKHHLEQLERKGFVSMDSKNKMYEKKNAEKSSATSPFFSIPIVGCANCGPATIFANENVEGYLKISKNILDRCKNIFAIKAHGLSMNKASVKGQTIEDGDYLIIDSDNTVAANGDIVLSVIDEMANIKKYVWDEANNQVVLMSESTQEIPPIYIHEDDSFMINGKVIQVIKKPKL